MSLINEALIKHIPDAYIMKIGRFVFQVVVFAQLSLFSLNSFSQGQGVTLVHVNDWGSGFIAQFQYVITDDDVALDNVRDWRWEANYQGAASLSLSLIHI